MIYIEDDRVSYVGRLIFKNQEEHDRYYRDLEKWIEEYRKEQQQRMEKEYRQLRFDYF